MEKLDDLGLKGAGDEEIIALAAENGFTITSEEFKEFKNRETEHQKINEEELTQVAGGGKSTQNRYDPKVCPKLTRTRYECVGFMHIVWCDHHREHYIGRRGPFDNEGRRGHLYEYKCAMGAYNYTGLMCGEPYQMW